MAEPVPGMMNSIIGPSRFEDQSRLFVQQFISELPKRDQNIFLLHYYMGVTLQEIADITGCSITIVKSTLRRTTTRLGKTLKGINPEGGTQSQSTKSSVNLEEEAVIKRLLKQIGNSLAEVARSNDKIVTKLERV